MSIELLIMLCLPLMGFNGSPLSYSSIFDNEGALHREIAMRILRALDTKRACNNLALLEEKVAIHLNLPEFKMVKGQGSIDLHEFCSTIKDEDLTDTYTKLETIEEHMIKCWLEQMYVPKQNNHRHAVIAIAGFLSQDSDLKNHVWL